MKAFVFAIAVVVAGLGCDPKAKSEFEEYSAPLQARVKQLEDHVAELQAQIKALTAK